MRTRTGTSGPRSERNIVLFGGRSLGLGSLGSGTGSWSGSRCRPSGRGALTAAPGIDESEALQHDFEFAQFLVSVLVFPGILFETTFDEQRATLFHVLGDDFGLTPPSVHINEAHFFFRLPALALPRAVDRKPD